MKKDVLRERLCDELEELEVDVEDTRIKHLLDMWTEMEVMPDEVQDFFDSVVDLDDLVEMNEDYLDYWRSTQDSTPDWLK